MKKIQILLTCILVTSAYAQNASLAGIDNYLFIPAATLNPAMAANMTAKWAFTTGSIDLSLHNNFLSIQLPYSPYRFLNNSVPDKYRTVNDNPKWDWNWIVLNDKIKTVKLNTLNRIAGPGVLIKQGNLVFSVLTDLTQQLKIDGLPANIMKAQLKSLMETGKTTGIDPNPQTVDNLPGDIRIMENKYVGITFGISGKWKLKNRSEILTGFHYLMYHSLGGYYFHSQTGGMNYDPTKGIQIKTPSLYFAELLPRKNILQPHGPGSLDLGFAYTYRNAETRRKWGYNSRHPDYKFRLGVSLLDLGKLIYTRTIITQVQIHSDLNLPKPEDLQNLTPDQLRDLIRQTFQQEVSIDNYTTYGKRTSTGMPSRIVVTYDFQFHKHTYFSAILQQNLRSKKANNMHYSNLYSVSIRHEYKYFSIGMPLTYQSEIQKLSAGLHLHIFQFYLGTRNLKPWIITRGIYGADIYAGLMITNLPGPFIKKKTPYMFLRKRGCATF